MHWRYRRRSPIWRPRQEAEELIEAVRRGEPGNRVSDCNSEENFCGLVGWVLCGQMPSVTLHQVEGLNACAGRAQEGRECVFGVLALESEPVDPLRSIRAH